MTSDIESSIFTQIRKRLREHESLGFQPTKYPRLEPKSPLPTPSPTVTQELKRAYQESSSDLVPVSKRCRQSLSPKPGSNWFFDYWIQNLDLSSLIGAKPLLSDMLPTIEASPSTCSSVPDLQTLSRIWTPHPSVVSVQKLFFNF